MYLVVNSIDVAEECKFPQQLNHLIAPKGIASWSMKVGWVQILAEAKTLGDFFLSIQSWSIELLDTCAWWEVAGTRILNRGATSWPRHHDYTYKKTDVDSFHDLIILLETIVNDQFSKN